MFRCLGVVVEVFRFFLRFSFLGVFWFGFLGGFLGSREFGV